MLGGALVAVTMCVVMVLVAGIFGAATPTAGECAWLTLVSLAGTWAVLIPSKFWEGTRGEVGLRRFVMMVIGLGLGVLAFGVASMLMVNLSHGYDFVADALDGKPPTPLDLPNGFYDGFDGHPLVLAHMAVFGALFLLIRWWRQADPLRYSRLSLKSVIITVIVAFAIAALLEFPHQWPMMVAGVVSASVQMASPWVPRRERLARKQEA
jgi:hypothetical protein